MLRTALKGLLAHRIRLASTIAAVMLGVAFLAGTLVLTDTIGETFDDLFTDAYDGTDAVVRREAAFSNIQGAGDQRGRVEASLLDTIASIDGVRIAEGGVQGYARLVDEDGDPIGDPEMGAPTFGGNWNDAAELNPFTLVAGEPPSGNDEVVVDRGSADEIGLRVGETTTVLTQGPPRQFRVSGIATFGEADNPGGASYVLFTTETAQELVAQPGMFDSILVVADDGVSQEDVAGRVATALPSGVEVITGDEITAESQDNIKEDLSFFNIFMLIFAIVALLVGSFMIFNTFSITVAQRTRENALFRAIGASKRQVLGAVLVEALIIGVLASVAGIAAGIAVASGLKALLSGFGFELPSGGVVLTPQTIVISLLVGVVVTVVAAVSPARKAGRVPPVAAMRDVAIGSAGYGSKVRVLVGLGILGLGVASLLTGLFGGGDNPLPLVALGVLLVFFGVSVLGRTVALPLSRVIGAPLPGLRGIAGTLSRENAMRNPKRTAATASALMIGVGLVGFISILASSTTASINSIIDRVFTGDYVIDSGGGMSGGVDPALTAQLNELPEVETAAGLRRGAAQIEGSARELTAVDPATAFEIMDLDAISGSAGDLGGDTVAVHEDVATDEGVAVGDTLQVLFKDTGPTELTVAFIYGENQPVGDYFVGLDTYEANFADQFDSEVYVMTAEGVSTAAALTAIEGVVADYPGAEVLDRAEFKADRTAEIDQILALIYALLGLSILIALLGIANTLGLSIIERTRELGLLRAVGMTRRQLRQTIRWESVIIALQGTVLGLLIGVFFGWALVTALESEGVDTLRLPYTTLAAVVALAGLAGVAAAVLPARRAAKLDVLRAIVTE